jgi:AcrR family transcriptional regulator
MASARSDSRVDAHRLPGEGNGAVGRGRVGELQRVRIVSAMTELVRERGARRVTVAHVVVRAGVSRRTFYELFDDREGCLLAAFDHAVERAARVVLPAYTPVDRDTTGEVWEQRVRAALAALLRFLDEEPASGGLLIIDALAAEHRVLERRARIVDALVDVVHRDARARPAGGAKGARASRAKDAARGRGVARPPTAGAPTRIVAEGVVGAVLAVIHARLLEQAPRPLSGLLNQLMGIVVLPYRGPAAAARELERYVPRVRRRTSAQSSGDPLRELDMRVTYRTVRVLLAISELGAQGPRPSGRQIADASGVSDPGQMSKLLARLAHLGLVHNDATGHGKGEPNAWTLTPKGREIEHAIRAQLGT